MRRCTIHIALGFLLSAVATTLSARPIVVLLTDFGLENEAVGLCHGAILSVDTEIQIVDLTHQVKPFDVRQGSRILGRATTFPRGTVFVAVVDPGVGTDRASVAVKTMRGFTFVAPNNGLLTDVIRSQGIESVVRIEERKVNPQWEAGTLDGRDLYAPAGALLAASGEGMKRIGRPAGADELVLLDPREVRVDPDRRVIVGVYESTDEPYGNVWTDITGRHVERIGLVPGDRLRVTVGSIAWTVPFVTTFGDVGPGRPLAYLNSDGWLALAINQGDLRRAWDLREGTEVTIQAISEGDEGRGKHDDQTESSAGD